MYCSTNSNRPGSCPGCSEFCLFRSDSRALSSTISIHGTSRFAGPCHRGERATPARPPVTVNNSYGHAQGQRDGRHHRRGSSWMEYVGPRRRPIRHHRSEARDSITAVARAGGAVIRRSQQEIARLCSAVAVDQTDPGTGRSAPDARSSSPEGCCAVARFECTGRVMTNSDPGSAGR